MPDSKIQTGTGVDPTALDYALSQLRAVCIGYPVAQVRARLTRATTAGPPTAVLTEAEAVVRGRIVGVSAVGHCPRSSIDRVADQLATKLQLACTR